MDIEEIREYCLSKKGATESMPFGNDVVVFKVMDKMFALLSLSGHDDRGISLNVKCDPMQAIDLRNRYDNIIPAYHMNKKYWNSIFFTQQSLSNEFIKWCIDHSVDEVVKKLPKKKQLEYNR